jgi:hypothetical protein
MDSSSRLPPGLRPPAEGDLVSLTWSADVGSDARVGNLGDLFQDLDVAVNGVGERWGTAFARMAAEHELMYSMSRQGPEALVELATEFGLATPDVHDIERWYFEAPWWSAERRRQPPFVGPHAMVRMLADTRTLQLMGTPVRVRRASYENPLEVVLTGSGFLMLGAVWVLRMVRDWSSMRRRGAAEAQQAEASARQRSANADLFEWLVEETKAGRLHVPPGDLLSALTASDGEALRRLAKQDIQIELPPGVEPPA